MNSSRNRRATLLLVEDEVLVRWATATVLRDAGYPGIRCRERPMRHCPFSRAGAISRWSSPTSTCRAAWTAGPSLSRSSAAGPGIGLLVTSGDVRTREPRLPDGSRFLAKPYSDVDLIAGVNALVTPAGPAPARRSPAGGSKPARWIWLVGRSLDGYRDNELGAARAVDRQARIHLLQDGGQDPHAHAAGGSPLHISRQADALIPDGQGEGL